MAHPELQSRGQEIIKNIEVIIDEMGNDYPMGFHNLSALLGEVVNFIKDALSARSPNDNIAANTELLAVRLRAIEKKLDRSLSSSPVLSTGHIGARDGR